MSDDALLNGIKANEEASRGASHPAPERPTWHGPPPPGHRQGRAGCPHARGPQNQSPYVSPWAISLQREVSVQARSTHAT